MAKKKETKTDKKDVKARDLAPKKDAKGGAAHASLAGGTSTSGRTSPAGKVSSDQYTIY